MNHLRGGQMISCTFAGHRMVFGFSQKQIESALETLLCHEDAMNCYVGGMGEFDTLSAAAVRMLKKKYPTKKIRLILVLPYMQKKINAYKTYYETHDDDILIPTELNGIYYKQAITARNEWMVDHADCLIALVWREYGGAYHALQYAKKKGKQIILLKNEHTK